MADRAGAADIPDTRVSDLGVRIARRIRQTGPITIADYMQAALSDPQDGYYITRDPFGAAGDFTTAPEISQMFGELLGLCLAQAWQDQGAPAQFVLAELGPGRGTCMADVLRATRRVPGFAAAAQVHLVETSPALRALQSRAVPGAQWHDSVDTLPDGPLLLIANEFFDALPVRQFVREGVGWRERVVGLSGGALAFGLTETAPVAALVHRLDDTGDGDLVEFGAPAAGIADKIAARIAAFGGTALIVDYGDWRSLGDTLQALRGHAPVQVLDTPGTADITAHVDFEALARAATAAGAAHGDLTPQGTFLERLGIVARAEALARNLSGAARDSHLAALTRLTHPARMGHLFKAMAIFPATGPPPPGFAP